MTNKLDTPESNIGPNTFSYVILPRIEDNSKEAANFYNLIYKNSLGLNESIEVTSSDPMLTLNVRKDSTDDFEFNGDVIFNFGKGRLNRILKLIDDVNLQQKYLLELRQINDILNISLLYKTGGMNLKKQNLDNDRGDTFIYALNQYFETEGKNSDILSRAKSEIAGKSLQSFLDYTRNEAKKEKMCPIFYYCYVFYNIEMSGKNQEIIKKLIESGEKLIDSEESAKEYLNNVKKFFKAREASLRKKNNKELNKMLDLKLTNV